MKTKEERISDILKTGLPPLENLYYRINDIGRKTLLGFRSRTVINSPELGVIAPEQYLTVTEKSRVALRLASESLMSVCREMSLRIIGEKLREADFVTVYMPQKVTENGYIDEIADKAIKSFEKSVISKICLEFSSSILYNDSKETGAMLASLRKSGFKTALCEFGSGFCPVMRLIGLPFDYVLLDESVSRFFEDEHPVIKGAIDLAVSNGATVFTCGVYGATEQLNAYMNGCAGAVTEKGETPTSIYENAEADTE